MTNDEWIAKLDQVRRDITSLRETMPAVQIPTGGQMWKVIEICGSVVVCIVGLIIGLPYIFFSEIREMFRCSGAVGAWYEDERIGDGQIGNTELPSGRSETGTERNSCCSCRNGDYQKEDGSCGNH